MDEGIIVDAPHPSRGGKTRSERISQRLKAEAHEFGRGQMPLSKTPMTVPTLCGNMATVDSKGRIVLPQEVRERLGITPGTEVEIHEEDGKAVVEPEDDPQEIIERMEQLVEETSSERGETTPVTGGVDPIAQKHRDAIRRRAGETSDE
jgi:AbrB family looped-hinge helix DNA binding protein